MFSAALVLLSRFYCVQVPPPPLPAGRSHERAFTHWDRQQAMECALISLVRGVLRFIFRHVFFAQAFKECDVKAADEYPLKHERERHDHRYNDQRRLVGYRFFSQEELIVKMDQHEHEGDPQDRDVLVMLEDAAPEERIFLRGRVRRQAGKERGDVFAVSFRRDQIMPLKKRMQYGIAWSGRRNDG